MTATTTPPISGDPGRGAVPTEAGAPPTDSRMWTSRLLGALSLAGFLTYGSGSILATSVPASGAGFASTS